MKFTRLARALLTALLLPLALAAACGGSDPAPTATPTQTAVPATATPAGPTATPTPDLAVLLRDGGISIIQTAYDRLLDEYIDPLQPQSLLAQAWSGVGQEARTEGLPVPAAPAYTGDRVEDFAAFRAAYVPLANSVQDAKQLRFAAIRTMAASLHDCHTFFLTPTSSDSLLGARNGNGSVGIGVELLDVPPAVTEVIPGGPADRAGIRPGDRVLAVDGTDTSSMAAGPAFDLINGEEGTSVTLTLRRPGQSAPMVLTMMRERVVPQNIETRVINAGTPEAIGYVRIREFIAGGVAQPLRDALTRFEAQDVTKWIIDIRGNPGGFLDDDAASLFIKDGVIVRRRGRDGATGEDRATGKVLPVVRPMVLLANDRTGSVAEMFAAALQDYGVAYVIGTTTNGCAGFTDIQPLGDGSSLAVTTGETDMPRTGKPLHGVGVAPDEAVARTQTDIANGRDPQLNAAIAHLSP
jgi:carboxyl-terminal processing protease